MTTTTLSDVQQKYLSEALSRPIEKYCIQDHTGRIVARSNSPVIHVFNNDADDAYAAEHYKLKEVFNGMKFWWGVESPEGLFQSADGQFYKSSELPENDDTFVKRRYADTMRAERNARISDTDNYIRLPDITVQSESSAKRMALAESDREELKDYRQQLRDLTDQADFPFVEWPDFPAALAYELQQKVNARNNGDY